MSKKTGKKITLSEIINEIRSFAETVFISLFVITMIFTYIFRVVNVKGSSMENTLMPEDRLITTAWCSNPEQGDIIIVNAHEAVLMADDNSLIYKTGLGKSIVKRVIATEGQTIDINFESGIVSVDGKVLDEPYVTATTYTDGGAFTEKYPFKVPEDCVFVLGDNRPVSNDSRSEDVGLIETKNIIGKVIFRISPMKKIGFIK